MTLILILGCGIKRSLDEKKAPFGALVLCVGDTLDNNRRLVLVAGSLAFDGLSD